MDGVQLQQEQKDRKKADPNDKEQNTNIQPIGSKIHASHHNEKLDMADSTSNGSQIISWAGKRRPYLTDWISKQPTHFNMTGNQLITER